MANMMEQLVFSLSLVAPIFFIISLGFIFKRIKWIDAHFIDITSRLVFNVALPAMLFLSIATADHNFSQATEFLAFSVVMTVAFFVFCVVSTHLAFKDNPDNGVLIQGSFRANTAIIGIAYVEKAFGSQGLALAAIYVAVITVVFNIQAVICLSPRTSGSKLQSIKKIFLNLAKNPLIIAIALGVVVSMLNITLPPVVVDTGNYLSRIALPLALLCTGGSLDFRMMRDEKASTWFAASNKLMVAPFAFTLIGYLYGFRGVELGILFFMNAAPVAAASYAMTQAAGGNTTLSANIIGLTTLFSSITVCLGSLAMKVLGLI
ncbi:AEC family transporter [Enterovibrio sp. ZSDZ35]|uniref:AEC family transporter n=1 Tax=Enterovibrio qingdaonensis TaxID=2899818 RepID=A0ABT5QJZ2_9GAMM|nr:AEC family transporter [Enterovibrio sp. ZSDZ35]MDD1780929.1 AEC family transporter [Enterovibrio sp. ZSDZ35]